ncbi:DUF5825 family protein [Streptomyces prunicolor]|uniref:DUF5825 family protein n=1 Tax=Streptomyces prunicolor TaxID=67348 RepID=UPI0037CD0D44
MTGPGLPEGVTHRATGRRIDVAEPLRLGVGGRRTAVAVQFLRECQSHGLDTHWRTADNETADNETAGGKAAYDIRILRHLPPPAEHPAETSELTDWRARYAYGMCYHRRGPDFVSVMDRRNRPASARFTLDHPDLIAAFDTLQAATPVDALSPVHREALDLLAAERLALVTDGWAVALPPRLRRWPVPCTGI